MLPSNAFVMRTLLVLLACGIASVNAQCLPGKVFDATSGKKCAGFTAVAAKQNVKPQMVTDDGSIVIKVREGKDVTFKAGNFSIAVTKVRAARHGRGKT